MKSNNYNLSLQVFDNAELFTPIVEAVTNSVFAGATEVRVVLNKQEGVSNDLFSGKISSIAVIDDGQGFTESCQDSFENIAQSNRKNCKGLGRLSFIRVFDEVDIDSVFQDSNGKLKRVKFRFDKDFTEINKTKISAVKDAEKTGTTIFFNKLRKDFSNSSDNRCDAKFCFSRIINYVLPLLCFHKCKLIVEADGKEEAFSLGNIDWIEWKKDEPIIINKNQFAIRYYLYDTTSDKAEDNYFIYLANKRAVSRVFPKGITNFKHEGKKLIVVVGSAILDSGVSVDWKSFNKIKRDEWIAISSKIKREIGELVSGLVGDFVVNQNLKAAKEDRPDLADVIDDIANQERWMAIEGKRAVIEEAEKRLSASVSRVMETSVGTVVNEHEVNNIRKSSLMQLTMTRWADLSKAAQICNNSETDEKEIHDMIYTQKTDSDSEEVNRLWLLDARWQYAEYISSENTILEMLGLNENEKDMSSLEIFSKHGIDLSAVSEKLSDKNFKKEFNKRPDIAIFNDDTVVIIELKKPGVNLVNHTEKIKYYAALIAFLNKNKYKQFYCYLVGSQLPVLNGYNLTADSKGYFDTFDLKLRRRNKYGEIDEESTNAKMYYEIREYNKFLKDCYLQHLEFFRVIGKKIDMLEAMLPEKIRQS